MDVDTQCCHAHAGVVHRGQAIFHNLHKPTRTHGQQRRGKQTGRDRRRSIWQGGRRRQLSTEEVVLVAPGTSNHNVGVHIMCALLGFIGRRHVNVILSKQFQHRQTWVEGADGPHGIACVQRLR